MAMGWCGARDHSGHWRDRGLVSWRRNIKGFRRIHRYSKPLRLRSRKSHDMPGAGRRIQPLEYREIGDAYLRDSNPVQWKFKRPLIVLGRGQSGFDGGPVGRRYRER